MTTKWCVSLKVIPERERRGGGIHNFNLESKISLNASQCISHFQITKAI
jgi:hypothetical protein